MFQNLDPHDIHLVQLRREFQESLDDLQDMAHDFSDGSTGRFSDQVAKCQRIRERLVLAENFEPEDPE